LRPRKIQHAEAEAVDIRRRQHERHRHGEVPSLCRGRRPHHAQREHVGTWEISRLAGRVSAAPVRAGKAKSF